MNRTAGVRKLVNAALGKLPKPYTEDVIEDAFVEIENDEGLRAEYDALARELGKATTNAWGGYWIAQAVGKAASQQVRSSKSALIESYSRLAEPAVPSGKKRKEPEALQLMFDYYREHKDRLSPSVRSHRELIVDMIVEGLPVEQVFAMVPLEPIIATPAQRRR
jgi:hypothetical protein